MKFLEQLQQRPEWQRKMILWLVVIILGILLVFLYIRSIQKSAQSANWDDFFKRLNVSSLQEGWNKTNDEIKQSAPQVNQSEIDKQVQEEMERQKTEFEKQASTSNN